jgi:excisionase family DNA binding protein
MKDEKTGSDFLKIDEAARYLGVTRRWVYRRIWSGDLPASKVGGLYFIRQADLEALIAQGRVEGEPREKSGSVEPVLKCGYCFRLLESDAQVGEVCAAEGCQALICTRCLAEGVHHCAEHVPDRHLLWAAAVEDHRQGRLPLLVKASQARLREVNLLQRFQTRLAGISTLRHPLTDEVLTVADWTPLLETGDERAEIMRLMNKAILETEWLSQLPLNAWARDTIPPGIKQKGPALAIFAQALSRTAEMIRQGFDTRALGLDELTSRLVRLGEAAQKSQTVTLVMLASTTGWCGEVRTLVEGEAPGSAFAHHWLLVYLNDLETHEILYNRLDTRLRGYADLFTSLLPEEEAEEVSAAILKEMGFYDSLTLQQALQALPYSQKSIERAFARLVASGEYALTDVPGLGQAIVRK